MAFKEKKCYVIAEIGQNHQGDLNIAKELIKEAKRIGADCVKFQKSNLKSRFTKQALERPYVGDNSFGLTYGEHKLFLEFSLDELIELKDFAGSRHIDFTASAMDIATVDILYGINVPFIKIGSGDSTNEPLLRKAASLKHPLVISTGMCNGNDVKTIYNTVAIEHLEFALLHCVSSYPTPQEDLNLNVILSYKKEFPDIVIGYSGHEVGFLPTLAAVKLGAKIIERHLTLNKAWKGSDHKCSLIPSEFEEMIKIIRTNNLYEINFPPCIFGSYEKEIQQSEKCCIAKLGKSIVAATNLKKGQVIDYSNISIKVAEPQGVPSRHMSEFIGKTLVADVQEDSIIQWTDI